ARRPGLRVDPQRARTEDPHHGRRSLSSAGEGRREMTVLGGYDVMTEIRASLVADLLEASLVLPGIGNVRTPFEYATSLVVSGFPIDIRAVVASIDVDLQTGRPLVVEARFTSGTLSNGSLRISPIEGVIRAAFDHRIDVVAGIAVLVLRPRDEDS